MYVCNICVCLGLSVCPSLREGSWLTQDQKTPVGMNRRRAARPRPGLPPGANLGRLARGSGQPFVQFSNGPSPCPPQGTKVNLDDVEGLWEQGPHLVAENLPAQTLLHRLGKELVVPAQGDDAKMLAVAQLRQLEKAFSPPRLVAPWLCARRIDCRT